MKRSPFVLLCLLPALLLGFWFAPAAGAKPGKDRVRVTRNAQKPLAQTNVLLVKVRSARKGRVAVRGFSATFDGRHRYRPLTRVARPRFRRAGQVRRIRLRLTPAGRRAVRSCEDRDIRAVVAGVTGRVNSMPRAMRRNIWRCAPKPVDLSRAGQCDFIAAPAPDLCMNPFPSNRNTLNDPGTETGRRINFENQAMPVNDDGAPIDATAFNASDGFSPGQTLLVRVPGLDSEAALARTGPPGLANPSRYLAPNSPVVVINTETGERHPVWVEIDSTASTRQTTMLMIHPQVNFDSGAGYIVALRHLKNAAGRTLPAPEGFRYYRDVLPSSRAAINQRRTHFDRMFRRLRASGIASRNLYLAWDFTVASDENNAGRALSMRDQAFSSLGDDDLADRVITGSAPDFTVDSVTTSGGGDVARRVSGTFDVPCFLEHPGAADDCDPGATMKLDGSDRPVRTGTWQANFECIIPWSVVDPPASPGSGDPASGDLGRALVYGHGLMGSISGEINSGGQRKLAARGFIVCGTDEIGMSISDVLTVVAALSDLSDFPKVADRLQQGLLNEMFLTRLMVHPEGLVSKAAFRVDQGSPDPETVPGGDPDAPVAGDPDLEPVLNTGDSVRAFYRGNSQGGIMGGALTALAPDYDHAALGVSAMNYSVLLTRSAAWDLYGGIFNPAYPDELNRPQALGLAQMLWDRGEPNGYAHRMTGNPLPDTPPHKVLMDIAFGDHLVTNWQANIQARTIGARAVSPFVAPDRWAGIDAEWGIEPITIYPYDGSAIAYWDSGPVRPGPGPDGVIGTGPPPIGNTAPASGADPHENPRVADSAVEMIDRFLRDDGRITNPCAPGPCLAGGYTGP